MSNRLSQPVGVPQYRPTTGLEPSPSLLDGGNGADYLARTEKTFSGLANEIGTLADRAAVVEGAQEGYTAGLDPEFRPTNGFSLRDQAFDKTGVETYRLTMKTAIARQAQEIGDKHENDPKATLEAFGKLRDQWAGEKQFAEVRPEAIATIERLQLAAVRSATRKLEGEQTAARKAALDASLNARFSAIDRASYGLGLDEKADRALAGEVEDLRRDVDAALKRGDMTPQAAQRTIAAVESTVAQSRILGAFDRLPSTTARKEFFDEFARRYSQGEGDFAKLDPKAAQAVQSTMGSKLRSEQVAAGQEARAIGSELTAIDKVASDGFAPTPEQLAGLKARAAAIGDPALAARLARTEGVISLAETGRKMRPDELGATLHEIDKTITAKGASDDALALRATGAKLLSTMREELGRDPLGWADRVGLAPVPAIDFSKPDAIGQMRDRTQRAEAIASYYGTKPVYLRPDEKAALERATAQGGETMVATAKALAEGFGPRAPAVLGELGKNAPVLAHVGTLLTQNGSEPFALDVADGLAQRNNPDFKLPAWMAGKPNDKMIAAQGKAARSLYGEAFTDAPELQRTAEAAAQAAFQARAVRRGFDPLLGDGASSKGFDRALQEAAGARYTPDGAQFGGVASYSTGLFSASRRVLVPSNIRADAFRDVMMALRDQDLTSLPNPPLTPAGSKDGKNYSARDLQAATPVAVRGGYRFALGDPASDDPKYIRGADGRPFVLDIEALAPVLRPRVPRAFLGGG